MRSFLTTIAVVVALVASTGTAVAKPLSDVGTPDGNATLLQSTTPAPQAAPDGGLGALTIVLLATGGVLALAGAASAGVHVGRRAPLRHSGV